MMSEDEDMKIECWECHMMREPVTMSGLCEECAEKMKKRVEEYGI